MNRKNWIQMLRSARLNTVAIIVAQAMLAATLATVVAGPLVGGAAVIVVAMIYLLAGHTLPKVVCRVSGARRLDRFQAPHIYRILQELAGRAGLSKVPLLVYLPHQSANAFTFGEGSAATVGISRGLLEVLTPRELSAVLAHEISHIRSGDNRLLGFAAFVTALCQNISFVGQILLLFNLPLLVSGKIVVDWTAILLLISAPGASLLLYMALARNREFRADLGAVELTGDPRALSAALVKLEAVERGLVRRLLWSFWPSPRPDSWLATHPSTARRIERLKSLIPSESDLSVAAFKNGHYFNASDCRGKSSRAGYIRRLDPVRSISIKIAV